MSNATITQLTQAIGITGAEYMEAVQAGSSVRVTASQIAALGATFTSSNVINFGADPSGVSDSTAAINAADVAATAAGQILYFPPGIYSINQGTRLTMHGASWLGADRNQSILKSAAGVYPAPTQMVTCSGKSNLTISRLGFDMSLVTFPAATTCRHLLMFNCTNWEVFDCAFTGIQTYNIGIYPNGGDLWSIKDCYFIQAVPSANQSQAINVQQNSGRHQICRNICIGTGIFSNGANGLYAENLISGWQFGGGIVLGPLAGCTSNRVIGNYCVGGLGNPDVNNTYSHGIECWSPNTQIIGNYCANNMGAGITIGGTNCVVVGNECLNNCQSGQSLGGIIGYGTLISAVAYSASNSVITNNQLSDNQGVPTQKYGYKEYPNIGGAAPITGVLVANNVALGNTISPYGYGGGATGGSYFSGSLGINGATPPAQPTGYGTPTGGAHQASFAAGSITLPNLAAAVAQLIIELKSYGLLAT